jgi:ankyrin repeat protein
MLAAGRGAAGAVRALLAAGAEPGAASTHPWPNSRGRTALHHAAEQGHAEAVQVASLKPFESL